MSSRREPARAATTPTSRDRQRTAPAATPRRSSLPYALLLPAVLALAVALGYPLVRQVVLSFQEFGLRPAVRPARRSGSGCDNYRELLDRPVPLDGRRSARVAFCLVNAAVTMVIGVGRRAADAPDVASRCGCSCRAGCCSPGRCRCSPR